VPDLLVQVDFLRQFSKTRPRESLEVQCFKTAETFCLPWCRS
jgi:hypothetical protein